MTKRILYLDLIGGAAGDMILAALIDLGASVERVQSALNQLGLKRVKLNASVVHPESLRAVQLDVLVDGDLADSGHTHPDAGRLEDSVCGHHHHHEHSHEYDAGSSDVQPRGHVHHAHGASSSGGHNHEHLHHHGHRPWRVIRDMIAESELAEPVKALAQDAFLRLAKAEAHAHGVPVDDVEFHEVGSDDAIADIVGVAVAIHELAIDRVVASPLPLGRGLTRGAHGAIPIPGPATIYVLRGAPTVECAIQGETVTPTGAALVQAMVDVYGPIPAMVLDSVGMGAGHKRWPDRPNIVRAILGTSNELDKVYKKSGRKSFSSDLSTLELLQMETNIDDMNPEYLEHLYTKIIEAGAVDVWASSAMYKKGRGGWVLSALLSKEAESAVREAFFRHTSTLGVRRWSTSRTHLKREIERISTRYGSVRVKRAFRPDGAISAKPEYDDILQIAQERDLPLRVVEEEVLKAVWSTAEDT